MTEQSPAPEGPIPITVVTGFLGAGKTSLINRLVTLRAGRERIGVVVNEAGEVGLDGQLLSDSSGDVVEIADGCVCCTSQGELLDAITRLHRAAGRLDRIIVETSGLADPGPVVDALASITHVLRLDTMVTVVDAVHAVDQLDRVASPEARQQLQIATHVVISKIDLAHGEAVDEVRARALALNPEATVVVAARDELDVELLLDQFAFSADAEHAAGGHHHSHDHLDVEIFSLELEGELDAGRFEGWLGGLLMLNAPDVFRIKAILALAGEPRRQIVHGVQTYVEQAPGSEWEPDDPRESRIVVIGRNLDSEQWRGELERCLVG
ncbi:MAG TPA: GTP-binding protein [Solirubrobacteraceae bacterium]|nr:GTP-binding protein [Solirubrobacteraceae bacterium]